MEFPKVETLPEIQMPKGNPKKSWENFLKLEGEFFHEEYIVKNKTVTLMSAELKLMSTKPITERLRQFNIKKQKEEKPNKSNKEKKEKLGEFELNGETYPIGTKVYLKEASGDKLVETLSLKNDKIMILTATGEKKEVPINQIYV